MDSTRLELDTPTAISLGRWAECNMHSFAWQSLREVRLAPSRESEIALAQVGLACLKARNIIRDAVRSLEARR